jgi:hypothetical protein
MNEVIPACPAACSGEASGGFLLQRALPRLAGADVLSTGVLTLRLVPHFSDTFPSSGA